MAKVWVRCTGIVRIDNAGVLETYHPGDWCKVGKQQARQLVATGSAEIPNIKTRQATYELDGCSVVLYGGNIDSHRKLFEVQFPDIKIYETNKLHFPSERVLFWDIAFDLDTTLLPLGFSRLQTGWQMCVPIPNYDILASNTGTPEERKKTQVVIRDLRVPIRDPRLIFVLACKDTEDWLECYKKECGKSNDRRFAYLRSFYKTKPIVCDLPSTWLR